MASADQMAPKGKEPTEPEGRSVPVPTLRRGTGCSQEGSLRAGLAPAPLLPPAVSVLIFMGATKKQNMEAEPWSGSSADWSTIPYTSGRQTH